MSRSSFWLCSFATAVKEGGSDLEALFLSAGPVIEVTHRSEQVGRDNEQHAGEIAIVGEATIEIFTQNPVNTATGADLDARINLGEAVTELAEAVDGKPPIIDRVEVKGLHEWRVQVDNAPRFEHAMDLAHHLPGIADVFEHARAKDGVEIIV